VFVSSIKGDGDVIRVYLVDDHTLLREGLRRMFSDTSDINVVGEAKSGHELLHSLSHKKIDVVVLDIPLPDMNSLDVLKEIKNTTPNIPVLILNMYSEDQNVIRAFRTGASGYLTKTQTSQDLINAVRKVASGHKYISEIEAEKLLGQLDPNEEMELYHKLSMREYKVMLMIASGRSIKKIADELNLSVSTINTFRSRILRKLNLVNTAEIISYVFRHKLLE
jgi:two-component system invasion response regulator UvrY